MLCSIEERKDAEKQCGRDIIPKINNIVNVKNICDFIKNYDIVLVAYENETKNTLFLWKNRPAVDNIKTMAEQLDIYYGKNRDIFADMGGYIVIIYGETTEIEKEHEEILNRHFLKKDFYEFEDIYEHEGETVTVRLYLCSSDYSVATVSVVHG